MLAFYIVCVYYVVYIFICMNGDCLMLISNFILILNIISDKVNFNIDRLKISSQPAINIYDVSISMMYILYVIYTINDILYVIYTDAYIDMNV